MYKFSWISLVFLFACAGGASSSDEPKPEANAEPDAGAFVRGIEQELAARKTARKAAGARTDKTYDRDELLRMLQAEMLDAAQRLEFEKAAKLRDRIRELEAMPETSGLRLPSENPIERTQKPGMARSRAGITGRKKRR